MKDECKTEKQLLNELVELRRRVTELEASETKRKHAEGVKVWENGNRWTNHCMT